MRPLKPTPKLAARYPRLAAAWALLAAPVLAHADATVPAPGKKSDPLPTGTAQIALPAKKPPCPITPRGRKPGPTDRPLPPRPNGGLGRADPILGAPFAIAIHPHGPEEPCQINEIDKEVT